MAASDAPATGAATLPDRSLPQVDPDAGEERHGEDIDSLVPKHGFQRLPVVALGGSAGCIPALDEFFRHAAAHTGLAYVVVLHLAPDHHSLLPELLQRHCPIPVQAAADAMKLEADKVYVIPPGKHLTTIDGHLRLTELQPAQGKRVAVDLFFRSLADTHGPHATAVVLSGADGDGAIGLKRIKERGGLTIAQDPGEAENDSMPRSAITTGMVDWVLRVAEMPQRIAAYCLRESRLQLPPESGPQPAPPEDEASEDDREARLREILNFLRARTGREFSGYKRATVVRRIARRMQVSGTETLADYLELLQTQPGEAGALAAELLVSVTNFFRDRESFQALQAQLAERLKQHRSDRPFRVWVVACATGEEAYSMAMLLLEQARQLTPSPALQVFASDLDEDAIQVARAGLYPETIAADVSEERLRRFFTHTAGGYLVRRELRELVLFANHDVLKDAPFSRVGLLSCRNLLIYLNREAQARCFEIFNFAMSPAALLFLGASETVPEGSVLFEPVERRHRLYRQRPVPRLGVPVPSGSGEGAVQRVLQQHERMRHTLPAMPGAAFVAQQLPRPASAPAELPPAAELHLRLLGRWGAPSALVDARYDIVHLSENAGRFLCLPEGAPTRDLLRLAQPALRIALRSALLAAQERGEAVEAPNRPVDIGGAPTLVDLRVVPAGELAPGHFLVLFEAQRPGAAAGALAPAASDGDAVVRQLELELTRAGERLRDTVEQYEIAGEDLKAGNEELQAMNEELRSAGEELESGREELQSVNEELTTLNAEFTSRVEELSRANSDLHNLMSATQIATVFLDRQLRVMRYTPSAAPLFNLISTDVGRPLSDLKRRLDYPELGADAEQVLRSLLPAEREMRAGSRWLLARMLPYRTVEDAIAGVVLTFIDITDRKTFEGQLRASEQRLQLLADAVPQIIWTNDREGRAVYFNRRWYEYTGLALEQSAGPGWQAIVHPDDHEAAVAQWQRVLAAGGVFDWEYRLRGADGTYRWFIGRNVPMHDAEGRVDSWFGTATDITERRHAEGQLRQSQEQLRLIVDNARDYAIVSLDLERRIASWNVGAQAILGYAEQEAVGQSGDMIFTPEDRAAGAPQAEAAKALRDGRASDERWHLRKDGSRFWGSGVMMAMRDGPGQALGLVKIFRDQTAELHAQQAMEQAREQMHAALREAEIARDQAQAAGKAKDHFLAVLSHELRAPLTPVLLGAQVLARNRSLPAAALATAAVIERNVRLQAHLVDDLLDVTRIVHGKMELNLQRVDLHEAAARAVEVAHPDIEAKGQHLSVELHAAAHLVMGDAKRLQQVFWNLLKNASKFTPEGGHVALRSSSEGERVRVEVQDNGVGFEPAAAERIFGVFEQGGRHVTAKYGGLGLGLAIAEASVKAHGGTIGAASPGPGRGATFRVELPLAPA